MGRQFQYLLDAIGATALGVAVGFAVTSVFDLPLLIGASLSALVFLAVFASLVRPPAVASLPGFVPAPLEFEEEAELLLVEPVAVAPASNRVVPLFSQARTPGEMHAAIERHLGKRAQDAGDATEDLRQALDQLRRSAL